MEVEISLLEALVRATPLLPCPLASSLSRLSARATRPPLALPGLRGAVLPCRVVRGMGLAGVAWAALLGSFTAGRVV